MNWTLNLDVDGVFADFRGGVIKTIGIDMACPSVKDMEKWKMIRAANPNFWQDLDFMPNGQKVWEAVKHYNIPYRFVTAFPDQIKGMDDWQIWVINGKYEWLNKKFGATHANICIVWREDKKDFSDPSSILIDDDTTNIAEFNAFGGRGILHFDGEYERSLEQLNNLLQLNS